MNVLTGFSKTVFSDKLLVFSTILTLFRQYRKRLFRSTKSWKSRNRPESRSDLDLDPKIPLLLAIALEFAERGVPPARQRSLTTYPFAETL